MMTTALKPHKLLARILHQYAVAMAHRTRPWTTGARFGLGLLCLSLLPSLALAQDEPRIEAVNGKVWMISGGGYANISVLAGNGRALMVDSKRLELAEEIHAMIREVSGGEVAFLINGHEHPDHTEGNLAYGERGAVIIAHEDVRAVLAAGQRGGPPAPDAALPVLTIADTGSMTLHFDGETVRIMHVPAAHSPSNLIVHYEQANVIHMGDIYSPERYPVVAGGTIEGFIEANGLALALADANTRFIAGNGEVTGRREVEAYRGMVATVRDRISSLVAAGNSLEQVIAAAPSAEFDATWGDPARFVQTVYQELAGN